MWYNSVRLLLLLFSYGCRICRCYIDIPSVHGNARRNYRRIATVTSTTTTTTKVLHYYYCHYNNYCSDGGYKKKCNITHTQQFCVQYHSIPWSELIIFYLWIDRGRRRQCSCVLVWEITAASSRWVSCDTLWW